METVEYELIKLHHEIVLKAIAAKLWSDDSDIFANFNIDGKMIKLSDLTFDDYMKVQIKTGHSTNYGNQWTKSPRVSEAWLKLNPNGDPNKPTTPLAKSLGEMIAAELEKALTAKK